MRLAGVVFAVLAVFVGASATPAPGLAQTGVSCELHLWGARRPPNDRFAGPAAPRGSRHADASWPLANINVLDPVQRLAAVSDDAFKDLLPDATHLTVIRHSEMLDPAKARSAKAPLSTREGSCSADFVLMDIMDLEGPKTKPIPANVTEQIAQAFAASNGMHINVAWRRFGADSKIVAQRRDRTSAPLAIGRSSWGQQPEEALIAINGSVEAAIRRFAAETRSKA